METSNVYKALLMHFVSVRRAFVFAFEKSFRPGPQSEALACLQSLASHISQLHNGYKPLTVRSCESFQLLLSATFGFIGMGLALRADAVDGGPNPSAEQVLAWNHACKKLVRIRIAAPWRFSPTRAGKRILPQAVGLTRASPHKRVLPGRFAPCLFHSGSTRKFV